MNDYYGKRIPLGGIDELWRIVGQKAFVWMFFENYWLPDCLDVCDFRFGSHDALNGVVEVQGCLVGCPRRYGDRYG